jgi:hypothetical protein
MNEEKTMLKRPLEGCCVAVLAFAGGCQSTPTTQQPVGTIPAIVSDVRRFAEVLTSTTIPSENSEFHVRIFDEITP